MMNENLMFISVTFLNCLLQIPLTSVEKVSDSVSRCTFSIFDFFFNFRGVLLSCLFFARIVEQVRLSGDLYLYAIHNAAGLCEIPDQGFQLHIGAGIINFIDDARLPGHVPPPGAQLDGSR